MAKRGREGIAKRARERARQQKQAAKRERRHSGAESAGNADAPEEAALMEEFRILSERHAAGNVSEDEYAEERQRIFEQLGIEAT